MSCNAKIRAMDQPSVMEVWSQALDRVGCLCGSQFEVLRGPMMRVLRKPLESSPSSGRLGSLGFSFETSMRDSLDQFVGQASGNSVESDGNRGKH